MLNAECVIYDKNVINAIFEVSVIGHLSCLDMAIWVLKDPSGPQECRPMGLNNLCIGLMA